MSFLTFTGTLQIVTCCHEDCGQKFAMEESLYKTRKNDHLIFYCPRGHNQHFPAKSEKELLEQELKNAANQIATLQESRAVLHSKLTDERIGRRNEVRSLKGAKTRILNRVKNGVCPCCNRTFKDLASHFKNKHPEQLKDGIKA